jgi:transposase
MQVTGKLPESLDKNILDHSVQMQEYGAMSPPPEESGDVRDWRLRREKVLRELKCALCREAFLSISRRAVGDVRSAGGSL